MDILKQAKLHAEEIIEDVVITLSPREVTITVGKVSCSSSTAEKAWERVEAMSLKYFNKTLRKVRLPEFSRKKRK